MNRTEFIGTNLYYSQEFVDDMRKNYNQENNFLKEMIRTYYVPEIERLNNIINELEKELKENK